MKAEQVPDADDYGGQHLRDSCIIASTDAALGKCISNWLRRYLVQGDVFQENSMSKISADKLPAQYSKNAHQIYH